MGVIIPTMCNQVRASLPSTQLKSDYSSAASHRQATQAFQEGIEQIWGFAFFRGIFHARAKQL